MSAGSLSPEQFAEDIAEAAETFDVIQANENTLLLDLDTPEAVETFNRVLPKVDEQYGVERSEAWHSKSGNNHVAVTLKTALPISIRIALQAALGSDGVREVLATQRMLNGCVEPSVLFRPKDAHIIELTIENGNVCTP
jgi:hypothetical protein